MTDPLKKVQPGQPLKIPASTFNTFIDAARDYRARQQNQSRSNQPSFRQNSIVLVKNGSGEDRSQFEVLGIDEPVFTPIDSEEAFKNQVVLVGVEPDEAEHTGRFVILLEPIPDGELGRAWISGVCQVKVDVQEEGDGYADVADQETGHLQSSAQGSARILWKESGTGVKWAVVRIGVGAESIIQKFELIDHLEEGQTTGALAWKLAWDDGSGSWERTEDQFTLYGDQGWTGVGFGRTGEVDSGDVVDGYFDQESDRWYAAGCGMIFFHGTVVEDIATGAEGQVDFYAGAGSEPRQITVDAYSPFTKADADEVVGVWWNSVSLHWDVGVFSGEEELGCGLERSQGKLKVKPLDLAGPGLLPSGDCGLAVHPGCGLKLDGGQIAVDTTALTGQGLTRGSGCTLDVNPGCGLETGGGVVKVRASDLAGSGLVPEGTCGLAINPGCGIWVNDDAVEVAVDELAGDGLAFDDPCQLKIDDTIGLTTIFSVITDVSLSQNNCQVTLTKSTTLISLDQNPAGVVIGFAVGDSFPSQQSINLCECDCAYDAYQAGPGYDAMPQAQQDGWSVVLVNGQPEPEVYFNDGLQPALPTGLWDNPTQEELPAYLTFYRAYFGV